MKRKHTLYLILFTLSSSLFMSADMLSSSSAPAGYTGETAGTTCTNCHGGNSLNASGGFVNNTLPLLYSPDSTYTFDITIKHNSANRSAWGFAMKAVANGQSVGTFSTTTPNTIVNGDELTHSVAPRTGRIAAYNFRGLKWKAPANLNPQDTIYFYLAGNAANGGASSGDFIYTNVKKMALDPVPTSVTNHLIESDQWKVISAGENVNIQMNLKKSAKMQVSIFSVGGQKLIEKPAQTYPAGANTIQLESSGLKSGTYIVILQNEKGKTSKKIIL